MDKSGKIEKKNGNAGDGLLQATINPAQKKRYYEQGYWTEKTMLDHWRETLAVAAEREYITDCLGGRFSYRDIDEQSSRLASYLRETGVAPGDIVACQIPVWVEFAVLALACLKVGAVLNPISVTYEKRDLRYFLELHQPVLFVCPTAFRNHPMERAALELWEELPGLKQVLLLDREQEKTSHFPTLREVLEQFEPLQEWARPNADDVALLLCTSGSTGVSKGAMLTHNNILFSERQFNQELGLTSEDVMFMPSPLNHATGFQHGLIATMLLGARVVLQQKFSAPEAVALMNREGCTYSMGSTTFVYDILGELEKTGARIPSLRFYLCGGAPVPGSMVQRAWNYGILLCEVYGSTESTPHLFVPPSHALQLNGTASGRPMEGIEVRVIDEQGREVAVGEEGEETSRGPNVFVGYTSGNASSALDDDGWFHSGDRCIRQENGFFRITGRIKDVIIRGGENLNACQLEENLEDCPQLEEYTVIGMPDLRMGERICACVVLKQGVESFSLEELREYLKSRQVPKWQWPERVECMDALPRTDSGKIKKYVLRQEIAKRLGITEPQGAIVSIG